MAKNFLEQLLSAKSFYPDETPERREELANEIIAGYDDPDQPEISGEIELVFDQVNGSPLEIRIEATEDGDLLRFRNAILAQAETNKNRDDISAANIDELAATLAGRAVDIDHDEHDNAGVITAARTVIYKGNPAVAIDGLGWRDRYPEHWDGVRAGTHHLSVEADADKATCSICAGVFDTPRDYCAHLKSRRLTGAKRGFIGLKGRGAGITTNPAGTETHFDREQIFVVAHQEPELEAAWYDGLLPEGETLADLPSSDFADPEGRRFPYKIHGKVNERGWKAAWSAAHGGHTGEKDESAIAKLKRDKPSGVDVTESQEEIPMENCPRCKAELAADTEICPACNKSVQAEVIAAELQASELSLAEKSAELATALASLEALKSEQEKTQANASATDEEKAKLASDLEAATTELATSKAALQAAEGRLAEIQAAQREALVRPLLTPEAWAERSAKFLAMDEDTFSTVAASLVDAAKKPAQAIGLRSGMPDPVAGSENGHSKISLR